MSAADDPIATTIPFFSATLVPHRSLPPKGFLLFMAAISVVTFMAGLMFWRLGAWPVMGFLGLDVVLIWVAFHLNYRAARTIEEVSVAVSEITVRRRLPDGREQEWRANPLFVRPMIDRHPENGVERIRLMVRGHAHDIGRFLNPVDRTSFAQALLGALSDAKRGGPG
jgi:uncharacterized membrane protein